MFLQLGYIACEESDWIHFELIWNDDGLSSEEIEDITISMKEIEKGKSKRFTAINEFLEELKSE